MKQSIALAVVAASFLTFNQSSFAANLPEATSLVYYSFGCCQNSGLEYGAVLYSPTFTSDSSGTIVINGWQTNDDPSKFIPKVSYSVVETRTFGNDITYGTAKIVDRNHPQSGTWYSREFTSMPLNKSSLRIKMEVLSYYNVRGAGNAY